jgi:hypothetical protein
LPNTLQVGRKYLDLMVFSIFEHHHWNIDQMKCSPFRSLAVRPTSGMDLSRTKSSGGLHQWDLSLDQLTWGETETNSFMKWSYLSLEYCGRTGQNGQFAACFRVRWALIWDSRSPKLGTESIPPPLIVITTIQSR